MAAVGTVMSGFGQGKDACIRALEIPRGHLRGTTLAWCVATQPRKSFVQLQLNSTIFNICIAPSTLVSFCNDILTFVLFLFLNILQ